MQPQQLGPPLLYTRSERSQNAVCGGHAVPQRRGEAGREPGAAAASRALSRRLPAGFCGGRLCWSLSRFGAGQRGPTPPPPAASHLLLKRLGHTFRYWCVVLRERNVRGPAAGASSRPPRLSTSTVPRGCRRRLRQPNPRAPRFLSAETCKQVVTASLDKTLALWELVSLRDEDSRRRTGQMCGAGASGSLARSWLVVAASSAAAHLVD